VYECGNARCVLRIFPAMQLLQGKRWSSSSHESLRTCIPVEFLCVRCMISLQAQARRGCHTSAVGVETSGRLVVR
jgi:hypothetical protein